MIVDYNILEKKLRSEIIKKHLNSIGKNKCVCFTCGNSSKYLREEGIDVLSIGEKEDLIPNKWFSYTEIQKYFNNLFDATSGHLPIPFMKDISLKLFDKLGGGYFNYKKDYDIKTGSGETIICLKMAYPHINFKPVRLKGFAPTKFNKGASLNNLLYAMFGNFGLTI
tara:strand:+ start:22 stop:522 length:501 start_codon:yes stop_codon:yes gene_type:complete